MLFSGDKGKFHKQGKQWSKLLLKICQVECNVIDKSKISNDKNYVFVSNHASQFDIPILLATLPEQTRIMYKVELEKVPVFGYCLKKSPFIAVKRSDPKNAMASLEEAINAMKENSSVIIFPEGTRSLDGNLLEFKRGAFFLATKSGKEIVPVTIKGSNNILPSGSMHFKKGKVDIIIDEEIITEGISDKVIMPKVKEIIDKNLHS
jgi:1-acyl-sn-glycerol-3-phosphate acyltransferase